MPEKVDDRLPASCSRISATGVPGDQQADPHQDFRYSSAFNLSRVFGPALAGTLLAAAGAAACFFVNAASTSSMAIFNLLAQASLSLGSPIASDTASSAGLSLK